jgi:hypothetical protein
MPRNPLLDNELVSEFFTDEMHFDGSEIISDVTANVGSIILDQASGDLTATTGDIGGVTISGGSLSGAGGASLSVSGSSTEITGGLSGPSGGSLGNLTVDDLTFANLNDGAINVEGWDNDANLAANSSTRIATQAAVKAYVDANSGPTVTQSLGSSQTLVPSQQLLTNSVRFTISGETGDDADLNGTYVLGVAAVGTEGSKTVEVVASKIS